MAGAPADQPPLDALLLRLTPHDAAVLAFAEAFVPRVTAVTREVMTRPAYQPFARETLEAFKI